MRWLTAVIVLDRAIALQQPIRLRRRCGVTLAARGGPPSLSREREEAASVAASSAKIEDGLALSASAQAGRDEEVGAALEKAPVSALEFWGWRGVVVVLCALWASNFSVIKIIISQPGVDSSLYAVARFSVAALALAPFAAKRAVEAKLDAETVRASASSGLWIAFGYLGQSAGLLTTTASRSCVICTLHCVFVAAVVELARVTKDKSLVFDAKKLLPALIAVVGVAVVELRGDAGAPTVGDFLSLAQPIGFGVGYVTLERIMKRRPDLALPVAAIKLSVVALASLAALETQSALETHALRTLDFGPLFDSPAALTGVLYTALVTTALALWVEAITFKRLPATDASIILTTEPLFAAAFAAQALGETFGPADYFGAALIIIACATSVLLETDDSPESANLEASSSKPTTGTKLGDTES